MLECDCETTELRHRSRSNQYVMQCLECGCTGAAIRHDTLEESQKRNAPEVDDLIQRQWWDRHNVERQEAYQERRTNERDEWFKSYTNYLHSYDWKNRRDRVLQRDGYMCQACLNNPATQVHHLTYKHWGNEPLFELVAVCKPCHDKLTDMDRNGNPGPTGEMEY